MIRIGEKLNSSIPGTAKLMRAGDMGGLARLIRAQSQCEYIDINTACAGDEAALMGSIMALAEGGMGVMPDSPDPEVLMAALEAAGDRPVIINSLTSEKKYDGLARMCAGAGCGVVAMPRGVSAQARFSDARELCGKLLCAGIKPENIYLDIVVEAACTGTDAAQNCSQMIRLARESFPGVRTLAGVSNISYGLPRRALLNGAFLGAMAFAGLDAAIFDVTDDAAQDSLAAAEALCGRDEYCIGYIERIRAQK